MRAGDPTGSRRGILALAALLSLGPAAAHAQLPHAPSCAASEIGPDSLEHPADHPARLVPVLASRIATDGYRAVVDSLVARYRDFDAAESVPPDAASRFAAELDSTREEFARVAASADPASALRTSAGVSANRFLPVRGASAGFRLFLRDRDLAIDTGTLGEPGRSAICGRALVMYGVLNLYAQPGMRLVADELQRKVRRWRNYHGSMPTQYPWELGLNGFATSRAPLEPPRSQWLLLHPSAAVEIAGSRLDALDRHEVAAMEWVGRAWSNADLSHSYGLSLLSTFGSDVPGSIGLMARYGRSLTVGVVTRRVEGRAQYGGLMSVDLYRLVTGGGPDEVRNAIQAATTRAREAADAAARKP